MAANENAEGSRSSKEGDENKPGDGSNKGKNTTERVGKYMN